MIAKVYFSKRIEFSCLFLYSTTVMNTIVPIASGKGGVGKTIFTANLGVALAGEGKTCLLVDLDLGSSNLHTCLGIQNNNPGIGNYIYKQESSLESLIIETETPRLYFIPGDSLMPATANLPYFSKKKILKELSGLVADYILIDLGAGSSYNVIDFFLASSNGLIVTTPETTSILSSYSFLKTTVYRLIFRSFPPKSRERQIIQDFAATPVEGNSQSFNHLVDLLGRHRPESGERARSQLENFFPRVILNRGRSNRDFAVGAKLREISRKNLGIPMEYIGFLPEDPQVSRSIFTRRPYMLTDPEAAFSRGLHMVARKLIATELKASPRLFDEDGQDIQELRSEFSRLQ
jgi:flagellar biosynthesis protein FlhG